MRLENYTVNVINIVIGALLVLSVISTTLLSWTKGLWSRRGRGSSPTSSETGQHRQAVAATESTNER
jgi:rhamnose transport system permease protein